ncbi:unnamed protein product [Zymoseptoria tritici ST99CH_1A5]|uniref:Uncharacterized protein n=1 Tax=Zymoseptoria tritici ST99CH_1A5 TaxID=1276529 RepID=A0A1Y6L536_ZYMTR|nr:unnamed protein product [Zymoseptoria tritici ST99CH_1A5]
MSLLKTLLLSASLGWTLTVYAAEPSTSPSITTTCTAADAVSSTSSVESQRDPTTYSLYAPHVESTHTGLLFPGPEIISSGVPASAYTSFPSQDSAPDSTIAPPVAPVAVTAESEPSLDAPTSGGSASAYSPFPVHPSPSTYSAPEPTPAVVVVAKTRSSLEVPGGKPSAYTTVVASLGSSLDVSGGPPSAHPPVPGSPVADHSSTKYIAPVVATAVTRSSLEVPDGSPDIESTAPPPGPTAMYVELPGGQTWHPGSSGIVMQGTTYSLPASASDANNVWVDGVEKPMARVKAWSSERMTGTTRPSCFSDFCIVPCFGRAD